MTKYCFDEGTVEARKGKTSTGGDPTSPPSSSPQSFSSINHPLHSSPAYGNPLFSDAYPVANTGPASPSSSLQPRPVEINTQETPGRKIALPRTPYTTRSSRSSKKERTTHACDGCRKVKAGCSGRQPCSRCKMTRSTCFYGDGKRDKEKKEMSNLNKEINLFSRHNNDVREALQQVKNDSSLSLDEVKLAISGILESIPTASPFKDRVVSPSFSARQSSETKDIEGSGKTEADADVGSTGSLDVFGLETDHNNARVNGYMGKSSTVSLQQRTADEISGPGSTIATIGIASYHTEDSDIAFFDTSDVNMYEWPDADLADMLIQNYFEKVHSAFPVLDKAEFLSNYGCFPAVTGRLSQENFIWLASLNTVFAISAAYAHLTMSAYRGYHYDHLIYIARAKMIFVDQATFFQDSRLSSVSLMGLLSLYYICTCRLNKAWTLSGLAIRHALTLGLHVRCQAGTLSEDQKEHRVRIWWSLYSLECSLSELTGRPTSISDHDISTPMPLDIDENTFNPSQRTYDATGNIQVAGSLNRRGSSDSQRSVARPPATYQMPKPFKQNVSYNFPALTVPIKVSSYFVIRTQLSIVAHKITTDLYCVATVKGRWSDVEQTIHTIEQHLTAWANELSTEFNVSFEICGNPDVNDFHTLSRTGLAMSYQFSRMILFRPCLCRIQGRISNQSADSKTFDQLCVEECIQSARRTIALLTWYSASPALLYTIPPFWNTIHCLCEALSVLVLELAFKGLHTPDELGEILADSKRGVNWLAMMAAQSISARKAWETFDGLIRLVAPMNSYSVSDMPTEAPVPVGYSIALYNTGGQTAPLQETRLANLASEGPLAYPNTISTGPPLGWGFREPAGHSSFEATVAPPNTIDRARVASNPLDNSTVTERFFTISQLHGHFDDPWKHIFEDLNQDTSTSMVAPDLAMMGQVAGQASHLGKDNQLHTTFDQSARSAYHMGSADIYGAYPLQQGS